MRDRPADLGIAPYGGTVDRAARAAERRPSSAVAVLREAVRTGTFWALGGELLRLRRDDRRPDRRALHPRRARPRDARDDRRRDARGDGHPRHRGHDRLRLADRPHGPAHAAVLVLRAARPLARAALQRARRPRATRSSCSWPSTGSTGSPPSRRRSRSPRAASGPRSPGSSSAGCSPSTSSAGPSRRGRAGYVRGWQGDYLPVFVASGVLCGIAALIVLRIPRAPRRIAPLPATAPATP